MFSKRLVQLRNKKGLTQYEAAERLGFSRGKLANYEQGTRQPDYETLRKIAEFYKVSIDFLLGRTNIPSFGDEKNSSLYFFEKDGLTYEELEDIKNHIDYVKWKAKEKREKEKDEKKR